MRIGRHRRANAVLTLCGLLLAGAPACLKRSRFENPEGGSRRDFGAELGMAGRGRGARPPGEGRGCASPACGRAGPPPAPSPAQGRLWRSPRTALTLCGGRHGGSQPHSLSHLVPSHAPRSWPLRVKGPQVAQVSPPHATQSYTRARWCPLTPWRTSLLSLGVLHLTGSRQPPRGQGLKDLEAVASNPRSLGPGLPSLRRRGAGASSTCPGEGRGRTHALRHLLAAGGSSALCHGRGGGWRPLGLCVRKRKGNN